MLVDKGVSGGAQLGITLNGWQTDLRLRYFEARIAAAKKCNVKKTPFVGVRSSIEFHLFAKVQVKVNGKKPV